jgi:hypothetical protein
MALRHTWFLAKALRTQILAPPVTATAPPPRSAVRSSPPLHFTRPNLAAAAQSRATSPANQITAAVEGVVDIRMRITGTSPPIYFFARGPLQKQRAAGVDVRYTRGRRAGLVRWGARWVQKQGREHTALLVNQKAEVIYLVLSTCNDRRQARAGREVSDGGWRQWRCGMGGICSEHAAAGRRRAGAHERGLRRTGTRACVEAFLTSTHSHSPANGPWAAMADGRKGTEQICPRAKGTSREKQKISRAAPQSNAGRAQNVRNEAIALLNGPQWMPKSCMPDPSSEGVKPKEQRVWMSDTRVAVGLVS